ncbi:hypothetical protein [Serratia plymuthica]|uniref:hypothetical protein n=1 Tax=Serratia plymuthica TaxID=82996 RepID=UPI00129040E0|nr:hypothetical protein [Serratia plymuthica]
MQKDGEIVIAQWIRPFLGKVFVDFRHFEVQIKSSTMDFDEVHPVCVIQGDSRGHAHLFQRNQEMTKRILFVLTSHDRKGPTEVTDADGWRNKA